MSTNKKAKQRTGQVDPVANMKADNSPESNQVRFTGPNNLSTSIRNAGKRKLPLKPAANY